MKIPFIDTHTGGEPTRVFFDVPELEVKPDLGELLRNIKENKGWIRSATVCEPRGNEVLVGALVLPTPGGSADAAVIFMNNVGFLGMCGHGTIGVVAALKYLGRISDGPCKLATPVGMVEADVNGCHATVKNVASFRTRKDVEVEVDGARVVGDVAWGGNWFFIAGIEISELQHSNLAALSTRAWKVRKALADNGVTGRDGAEIDHIEFASQCPGEPLSFRNFVLCPGGQYDRSPCGTGTSAKMACLAGDSKLAVGELITVTSIIDSSFHGSYQLPQEDELDSSLPDGSIIPSITGSAFVTAEGKLVLDPEDDFRLGLDSSWKSK